MQLSRRQRYYDTGRFPEVEAIREHWQTIRDEARVTFGALEERLVPILGPSYVLPLIPEAEDKNVVADVLYEEARRLSPQTTERLLQIPYVVAFAYSRLVPGKHIAPHEHWNPYLVAILCLEGAEGCHIIVGGERRDFHDGEMLVFDYTLTHESKNEGTAPRHALLVVMDPRKARATR